MSVLVWSDDFLNPLHWIDFSFYLIHLFITARAITVTLLFLMDFNHFMETFSMFFLWISSDALIPFFFENLIMITRLDSPHTNFLTRLLVLIIYYIFRILVLPTWLGNLLQIKIHHGIIHYLIIDMYFFYFLMNFNIAVTASVDVVQHYCL